jgi:medium-chain acyl-[acyl-carrier-protein] hydrolase
MATDPVLPHVDLSPAVRLRLVTFAHAGGGAVSFLGWKSSLPEGVSLCPTRRAGRESRYREPPLRAVVPMAQEAARALLGLPTCPTVLLGHSVGALVAFEVVRILQSRDAAPLLLVVSGRPAPQLPPAGPPMAALPSALFIDELERRYGRFLEQESRRSEVLELMLPALRADLEASETYRAAPGAVIHCPIWACYGKQDRAAEAPAVQPWAHVTDRGFEITAFDGGHFFIFDPASGFLRALAAQLTRQISR